MIKVVLDTNTLISAIGWKESKPRIIFEGCLFGKLRLIESIDLLREFAKVIQRPKFDFITEDEKEEFLVNLMKMRDIVETSNIIPSSKDVGFYP